MIQNDYALSSDGRRCQVHTLTREVLIVATNTHGPYWKAYVGVVAGKNHSEEWEQVLRTGYTVDLALARFLFPDYADLPYGR